MSGLSLGLLYYGVFSSGIGWCGLFLSLYATAAACPCNSVVAPAFRCGLCCVGGESSASPVHCCEFCSVCVMYVHRWGASAGRESVIVILAVIVMYRLYVRRLFVHCCNVLFTLSRGLVITLTSIAMW